MNGIRAKELPSRRPRKWRVFRWLAAFAIVAAAIASFLIYDDQSGRFGILGPAPIVEQAAAGKIIKLPPGGNINAALRLANSGDIIELQAGAVYAGTINLPNKPLTDFVTIRSSAYNELPADVRVSPKQRAQMATITAGILGRPAIRATAGSNHYRFIGIEFTTNSKLFNYGLVELGRGEKAADLPNMIEIDRSYFHPHIPNNSRRAVALNSSNTIIKNSYIEGFSNQGEEAQGICGWTGTRNVKIVNNYIEGAAENIMFGGSDPSSADLIPIDIEIRGNHLNKPPEWRSNATIKTLFELKNAKRVQLIGNLLTNNWTGSAFRITVRNQDNGAPFSTIEDVLIKDNIIDGSGDGINILGKDDNHPSQILKRLIIENNVFLNLKGGGDFEGSGYFLQVSDGENITIANNTSLNSGNIATFYGVMPRNFVFKNNIVGHGAYGVHGPLDMRSPATMAMFTHNLFLNLNGVPSGDFAFPQGNEIVNDLGGVGFADIRSRDLRLLPTSKFQGKGFGAQIAPIVFRTY